MLLLASRALVPHLLPLVVRLLQVSTLRVPGVVSVGLIVEALCSVSSEGGAFGAQVVVELFGCFGTCGRIFGRTLPGNDDELLEICDHPSCDSGAAVTSMRAPPSQVVSLFLWHSQSCCGTWKG